MAEQRKRRRATTGGARDPLYQLALRLGPLLEPQETVRGVLEACADLAAADAGLLLADGLPPAALGAPVPLPDVVSVLVGSPELRAARGSPGVTVLPAGAAPLPGATLVAVALPGTPGPQGMLLLSCGAEGGFREEVRAALAAAAPLAGQALDRARRHATLRGAELFRDGAVGRLAHDIRSPLVASHAAIEVVQRILRGRPVPESIFEALTTGLRSVQTAVELCNDLLEVSRLQHGFAIAVRPVPLGRMIDDVTQMLRPIAEQRGVDLEARPPDQPLVVAGDERLLRRMLTNLVANGLRFAPPGGFVRVEGLPGDTTGSVLLRVSDNGPGIAQGDKERVFIAFAQGPGESGRGVGLGLALCREVAQAHGGRIWAEAREGGGTQFTVLLPAA
jgi:signal transduction histidine kinase